MLIKSACIDDIDVSNQAIADTITGNIMPVIFSMFMLLSFHDCDDGFVVLLVLA